ncbi:Golgin subfamily A member 7 [Hypsizygus marmoreus]|uniref:Ras modification protein ERF4 n=1 Tax=Hypsizygus marmoreus TaxID=39966 RepID=A0A369K360_HYPMA|nr:Golgin subfamily A member 7 [Hypsizygus marmoreus]
MTSTSTPIHSPDAPSPSLEPTSANGHSPDLVKGTLVETPAFENSLHLESLDDSAALQEQTMVASEDAHGEAGDEVDERRLSSTLPLHSEGSPFQTPEKPTHGYRMVEKEEDEENEKEMVEVLDPLRTPQSHKVNETQELTMVVEEDDDDIGSTNGGLCSNVEKKPQVASRRASHLHLDLKPPSPQPWDLVDPPDSDGRKGGPDYYSTLGSRKFHTLQSTTHTRPLIPKSSYYFGPPPSDSAFGTPPVGQIGLHHPREIIRIERDYTGGELVQFAPIYPLELEGRITPTHFLESINAINELLISAYSLRHSFLDNMVAVFSLQLSKLFWTSHYEKEMHRLQYLIDDLNTELYNPVGLNILWPRNVAFLFLEIEYY